MILTKKARRAHATRPLLSWAIALSVFVLALGLYGCDISSFHDSITTSVEIPETASQLQDIEVSKAFIFERDLAGAKAVHLDHSWLENEAIDADLAFVSSVEILAVDPQSQEEILLITGSGFAPGERHASLEVVYEEDLLPLIDFGANQGQRIELNWRLKPQQLQGSWSEVGGQKVQFGIVVKVEVE